MLFSASSRNAHGMVEPLLIVQSSETCVVVLPTGSWAKAATDVASETNIANIIFLYVIPISYRRGVVGASSIHTKYNKSQ